MLQKPKTKNGYSGRILALPVAIAVAFTLMVKAKNQEIAKVNSLVNSAKNDTIPKKKIDEINAKIQAKNQEIEPLRKDLDLDYESARIIGEQLREKGELLQKLTNDKNASPKEIDKVSAEMDALSDKIERIFDAKDFKNKMSKMDKHFADLDKFYASKDFKNSLNFSRSNDAEGIQVKAVAEEPAKVFDDAEESAKEAKKVAYEASRTAVLERIKAKEAEKRAKEIDTEEARQLAKKAYEKAEEARKFSKIAHEKAGIETIHIGRENVIVKNKNDKGNLSYYLDGKPISEEEMKKIPADKIERVNVVGIPNDDSSIYITSKK